MPFLGYPRSGEGLGGFDNGLGDVLTKVADSVTVTKLDIQTVALRCYVILVVECHIDAGPEGIFSPAIEVIGRRGYLQRLISLSRQFEWRLCVDQSWFPHPKTAYLTPLSSFPSRLPNHSTKWTALSGGALS